MTRFRASALASLTVVLALDGTAAAQSERTARWPQAEWVTLREVDESGYDVLMARQPCTNDFLPFVVGEAEQSEGLKTDSLVVVRDGQIVYEYYDAEYDQSKPHCL
jgi:hypothetical protein